MCGHHVSFYESLSVKHRHPPPRAREREREGDREGDMEGDREEEGVRVAEVRVRENDT